MKVLIDTNIFLHLYSSTQKEEKIFEDIKKIENCIILPDQIIDEFYRNRDNSISDIITKLGTLKFEAGSYSFVFIRNISEFAEISRKCKECSELKRVLIKKISDIKENPENDPIYTDFKNLVENPKIQRISIPIDIVKKAHCRYLRGNPPKSPKKDSIGDEIIWEAILSKIEDDLIIVSDDLTYTNHHTFLKNEFSERTGKRLILTDKLGEAVKLSGELPSEETERFDDENQKRKETISEILKSSTLSQYFDQQSLALSLGASLAGMKLDQMSLANSFSATFADLEPNKTSLLAGLGASLAGMKLDQMSLANSVSATFADLEPNKTSLLAGLGASLAGMELDRITLASDIGLAPDISKESKEICCPNCHSPLNPEQNCDNCGYSKNTEKQESREKN